jgi:hypothetical protein
MFGGRCGRDKKLESADRHSKLDRETDCEIFNRVTEMEG